jgi:hypothetical protein
MKRFDRINLLGNLLSDKPIRKCYVIQHLPKGPEVRAKKFVEAVNVIKEDLAELGNYDNKIGQIRSWRYSDLTNCACTFYAKHCELDLPDINLEELGQTCGRLAIEYFFGDWREGYADRAPDGGISMYWDEEKWSREKCRKKMDWIRGFHRSLLCTLLIDNIDFARHIAKWVDEDLWDTYLNEDSTVEDVYYFTILGKIICGESWEICTSITEKILKSHRRRPKLLLDVLESIVKKDDIAFEKTIHKYLKHFLKNEIKIDGWYEGVISIYASVLWNYARLEGIKLPLFSEEIMDRIITPQSVGLVK